MKIYRWKTKEGELAEYRFGTLGKCTGFFVQDEITERGKQYVGKKLTKDWENNLEDAGFKLLK